MISIKYVTFYCQFLCIVLLSECCFLRSLSNLFCGENKRVFGNVENKNNNDNKKNISSIKEEDERRYLAKWLRTKIKKYLDQYFLSDLEKKQFSENGKEQKVIVTTKRRDKQNFE